MTILTKTVADKKPIVATAPTAQDEHDEGTIAPENQNNGNIENGDLLFLIKNRKRASRTGHAYACLTAVTLIVVCLGFIGSLAIYHSYARAKLQNMRYHGFCGVQYDTDMIDYDALKYLNQQLEQEQEYTLESEKEIEALERFRKMLDPERFFKEEVEMESTADESYTKITVPQYRDGQSGRFIHDFYKNESAIVDVDHSRCFVMPLDRERILEPHSFMDIITNIRNGIYDIDTENVRSTMRIILPALNGTELNDLSGRILETCKDMKIYRLEKLQTGVYKRSVDAVNRHGRFAEFGGKNIVETDIVNMPELEEYENNNN